MQRDLFFKELQESIGYRFKNPALLRQAFTRRSYSEEQGGECNEVLEFIGDKALDLAVIKYLSEKFGQAGGDGYACSLDEGELTRLKSRMVEKRSLAKRIDELGFSEGLIMGKSDIKNRAYDNPSVKEDLFEAILGAVALDCGWDFSEIQSAAELMLMPEGFLSEADGGFVQLVNEWSTQENSRYPVFRYFGRNELNEHSHCRTVISQPVSLVFIFNHPGYFYCELELGEGLPIFQGVGASKTDARRSVCELAYKWLRSSGYITEVSMADEIDKPEKAMAINQLETLARRGYFSLPRYDFSETHGNSGQSLWRCTCRISEYNKLSSAVATSKKEAKKEAALELLNYVLENT